MGMTAGGGTPSRRHGKKMQQRRWLLVGADLLRYAHSRRSGRFGIHACAAPANVEPATTDIPPPVLHWPADIGACGPANAYLPSGSAAADNSKSLTSSSPDKASRRSSLALTALISQPAACPASR